MTDWPATTYDAVAAEAAHAWSAEHPEPDWPDLADITGFAPPVVAVRRPRGADAQTMLAAAGIYRARRQLRWADWCERAAWALDAASDPWAAQPYAARLPEVRRFVATASRGDAA